MVELIHEKAAMKRRLVEAADQLAVRRDNTITGYEKDCEAESEAAWQHCLSLKRELAAKQLELQNDERQAKQAVQDERQAGQVEQELSQGLQNDERQAGHAVQIPLQHDQRQAELAVQEELSHGPNPKHNFNQMVRRRVRPPPFAFLTFCKPLASHF